MSTETPWAAPRRPAPEDPGAGLPAGRGGDIRSFITLALLGAAAGPVVGALWRGLAPAVRGVVDHGTLYFYAAPEGKAFVGRDGWFAALGCGAALLLAAFAFVRYREGPSTGAALGLAAGGVGGARLAAWFGGYLGPGRGSVLRAAHGVADGAVFDLPVRLRATGVIWLWPLIALALFFVLMLVFGPADAARPEPYPDRGPGAPGPWPPGGPADPPDADGAPAVNSEGV